MLLIPFSMVQEAVVGLQCPNIDTDALQSTCQLCHGQVAVEKHQRVSQQRHAVTQHLQIGMHVVGALTSLKWNSSHQAWNYYQQQVPSF